MTEKRIYEIEIEFRDELPPMAETDRLIGAKLEELVEEFWDMVRGCSDFEPTAARTRRLR